MEDNHHKLNMIEHLILLLLPLPVFIGGYITEKTGITSILFLLICLTPLFFSQTKNVMTSLNLLVSMSYIKVYAFYILLVFISLIYSINKFNGVSILISLLLPFILGLFMIELDIKRYYKIFSWYSLFYLMILYIGIPGYFLNYYQLQNRFGHYEGDINLNPNSISIFITLISISFFNEILNGKSISKRFFYLLPYCISLSLLIATQSRTGVATMLLVVGLSLIQKKTIFSYAANYLGVLFVLIFYLFTINTGVKMDSRIIEADLNGREDIWEFAITSNEDDILTKFVGNGIGSAERLIGNNFQGFTSVDSQGYRTANPHNMYLENYLNLGILGLFLLLSYIVSLLMFMLKKRGNQSTFIALMILLTFAISGFAGNHMRAYFYFVIYTFVIAQTIKIAKKQHLESK